MTKVEIMDSCIDPKSDLVEIVFLLVLISWSVALHFTLRFA
jgi:hypothetical protein